MKKDVNQYFGGVIMPLIREKHPHIADESSIMILGSVGLGIDDAISDMEAVIYLPDDLWKRHGAQLQLDLNQRLSETNPWRQAGSIISVHPLSWTLDNQGLAVLSGGDIPWDKITFESLYEIQNNLILHDPSGRLSKLRFLTAPDKMPEPVWNKALFTAIHDFIIHGFGDLWVNLERKDRLAEFPIHLGTAVENLFRMGFYISRQYHPWKSHWRWAIGHWPAPLAAVGAKLDILPALNDWHRKMDVLEEIFNIYRKYAAEQAIFPAIDLSRMDIRPVDLDYLQEEIIWPERLKAWENPGWREFLAVRKDKAARKGYPESEFWIWSLWGMDWDE